MDKVATDNEAGHELEFDAEKLSEACVLWSWSHFQHDRVTE